jgi:tetratricopeptide (TPR) repeat protein
MLIHSKKIERFVILGTAILICSHELPAQQPSPAPAPDQSVTQPSATSPSAPVAPSAAGQAPSPASSGAADSSTASALDYLFNHKPQQGSVAKEGMEANQQAKTDALAQDALGNQQIQDPDVRAQFETYLAMNEVPQAQLKSYSDDMTNVIDLLHQRKTTQAWQQLYQLAKYQSIDAGVSWELANRIESIWNAGQTKDQIAQQNNQLQQRSDTDNRNADMDSDDIKDKEIDYARRMKDAMGPTKKPSQSQSPNGGVPQANTQGQGDNTPTMTTPESDQLLGKLQLTQEYLDSLATQAKIKLNELKVEKLFDQAKQDFADYITTLYKSGRYQHVLIAADFWRQIFDEGDYPVSMAQQVNASLETIGQVNTTIGVFNNNLDQKDIAAATNNLQQAYVLSEFSPAVLGVPLANKKPILALSRELNRMRNMIEARDFTDLESILTEIKQTAPDFDAVKAMSIINGVKLESQLDLGKAKLAAQQGDLKSAMEDFQQAAEAWPGNPDLKDKALSFFNSEDTQNQSLEEFDRLVAENNYRAIYDKQLAFAPAMKDDTKRQDQLKAALEKVKIVETAVEKATLMQANGDVDGAWETVQLAIKDLPDDVKLNSLRGDLAGKGAEFVSAISKAQDAESKQELGYSLSWYAVAQRYYPASQIANQAIDRISKAILAKSGV